MEWQPIATVPKDGTNVLVFEVIKDRWTGERSGQIAIANWTDFNGGGWVSRHLVTEPSSWMPLPQPPEEW